MYNPWVIIIKIIATWGHHESTVSIAVVVPNNLVLMVIGGVTAAGATGSVN